MQRRRGGQRPIAVVRTVAAAAPALELAASASQFILPQVERTLLRLASSAYHEPTFGHLKGWPRAVQGSPPGTRENLHDIRSIYRCRRQRGGRLL